MAVILGFLGKFLGNRTTLSRKFTVFLGIF